MTLHAADRQFDDILSTGALATAIRIPIFMDALHKYLIRHGEAEFPYELKFRGASSLERFLILYIRLNVIFLLFSNAPSLVYAHNYNFRV